MSGIIEKLTFYSVSICVVCSDCRNSHCVVLIPVRRYFGT